jgi:Fe-S oxidoreductase
MSGTDELEARLAQLEPADFARGLEVFRGKLREAEASYLETCVRCGLCADACHYYRADHELESIPARKLGAVVSVFKRHCTLEGRLVPSWLGARSFDRAMAREWVEAVFGRCSLCGRCSLNCSTGIHIATILRAARSALAEMNLVPSDLQSVVSMSLESGNNMGIAKEDWLETVEWIEEELQTAVGDPLARIPVDKEGARVLFTVNPREPKFFPLTLQASATVFHAAKEDWTVASDGWDLTNYGLFTGDAAQAGAIADHMLRSMQRLGCRVLVIGECGHGYASARWESPEWLGREHPFEVRSVLELMDDYLREGRIKVDPDRHPDPVTLHDPCNLVRHGGVSEPQRSILRRTVRHFVEMTPNRAENFCCGGGGGQLAMAQFQAKRLQAGGMKAEQIRRSGAKTVVAPCHNCIDQLMELNREYKLGVSIKTVAEMVADALVFEPSVGH